MEPRILTTTSAQSQTAAYSSSTSFSNNHDSNNDRTASSSKPSLLSGTKNVFRAVLVAWLAYVGHGLYSIYDRHFLTQDWDAVENFRTNTTFVRRTTPMTYYRLGRLHEVLPKNGWLSGPDLEGFHVFRLDPKDRPLYEFDFSKFVSVMAGTPVVDDCENNHGFVSCLGESCVQRELASTQVSVQDMLGGNSSRYFANFIGFDPADVDLLEAHMQLPQKLDRGHFEQAFISNFKEDLLTTPLHASPLAHSMAYQFIGERTWIFFRPKDYESKEGFFSTLGYGPMFPQRAPTQKQMEYFGYKSMPGDVLFFPPKYGHVVYTHKGKNLMANFRHLWPAKSVDWRHLLHTAFNVKLLDKIYTVPPPKVKSQLNISAAVNQVGPLLQRYREVMGGIGCHDDHPQNLDRILADLIVEVANDIN